MKCCFFGNKTDRKSFWIDSFRYSQFVTSIMGRGNNRVNNHGDKSVSGHYIGAQFIIALLISNFWGFSFMGTEDFQIIFRCVDKCSPVVRAIPTHSSLIHTNLFQNDRICEINVFRQLFSFFGITDKTHAFRQAVCR